MNLSYSYASEEWWGQSDQMAASVVILKDERYLVILFAPTPATRWEPADYAETGETKMFLGLQNALNWVRAKDDILQAWATLAAIEVSESDIAQRHEQMLAEDAAMIAEDLASLT